MAKSFKKSGNRDAAYEVVTNFIIKKLEDGIIPWRMPWNADGLSVMNGEYKKPYNGINFFILSSLGFTNPYFLTIHQINRAGGKVKQGEHGFPVVYWKFYENTEKKSDGTEKKVVIPRLFYHKVFNINQCTGLDDQFLPPEVDVINFTPIEVAEQIVSNYPNAPKIIADQNRAAYQPLKDEIYMPSAKRFASEEEYYSTLFHETIHSTGHQTRLDRLDKSSFGSQSYSKEELIAEMGAAFLCAHCHIEDKTLDNSAAYIQGWLSRLKEDPRMIVQAASKAQKAVAYILGEHNEE